MRKSQRKGKRIQVHCLQFICYSISITLRDEKDLGYLRLLLGYAAQFTNAFAVPDAYVIVYWITDAETLYHLACASNKEGEFDPY